MAQDVIRQQTWTDEALRAAGFRYYERRKQVTMVRELPPEEAPKTIKTSWDTLVAQAGCMIVYNPVYERLDALDDYEHWPVQPEVFHASYKEWDEPDRTTTPAEMHLLQAGCLPYFKYVGVWARQLTAPTWVQSLESPEPALAPVGAWLCIGVHGEPWVQSDEGFRSRYIVEESASAA